MPLNPQLRNLGGQFCHVAKTIPAYSLYAHAGQIILKPGLLRSDEGKNPSINVAVRGLPPEGFGGFVVAIPSPLRVETLAFADGTNPIGIFC